MRLRISFWRMLKIGIIATLIGAVLVFLGFYQFFVTSNWTALQPILIMVYLTICICIFVAVYFNHYYEVTNKEVIVKRLGKLLHYRFNEIIYIDEEQSRNKKTVTFVTSRGDAVYLTYDKEGKLIDILLKECKNLITLDELKAKFPNIYF